MKKLFIGLFIIVILLINIKAAYASTVFADVTHNHFYDTYTVEFSDTDVDYVLIQFSHTDGSLAPYQTIIFATNNAIDVHETIYSTGGTLEVWVARIDEDLVALPFSWHDEYQIVLPMVYN